jgi:hypothetical protein
MDNRSIINPDEDGIFQQWKALHYIECDLLSKTILDTDGQAIPLSRVSFLIEGNIPKFLDAMGLDDHGNINTKEARNCAANILADRPYWTNQQKIDGKFLPLSGQYVDVTRLGGGSPSRPETLQFKPTLMLMNGILQLPNTGWLITAAKAFAGFPGHLLGPANE